MSSVLLSPALRCSKQLRTRECERVDLYLYVKTDPIIEMSSGMRFAPFNGAYPGIAEVGAAGTASTARLRSAFVCLRSARVLLDGSAHPLRRQHFSRASLDASSNHWSAVFDFNDEARTGAHWSYIGSQPTADQ
jgi:hypothetical protein